MGNLPPTMAAQLLGAHMPAVGGLQNAIQGGFEIGCTAIQVFTSSPQMWKSSPVTPEKVRLFKQAVQETGIDPNAIVCHDSYLINLCAPDDDLRQKSIEGLKSELERCALYGIPYTVSHMGSHVGQGEGPALGVVAESTLRVLAETPETTTILMETTAGQGSSLNYRFEHLALLLELTGAPERLAVCLDTCHIFSAGYDIRTDETYDRTFEEFGRLIGFDKLKAIHCNDSKNPLGKRVDRHEHIGEGHIGPRAFQRLVNDPRFERVPILLETPDAPEGHVRNLETLRSYMV
jgi:deoxyribonuclease-4